MKPRAAQKVLLGMIVLFLLWSLFMIWYGATMLMVVLLPVSALLGWIVGRDCLAPSERNASMERMRGKKIEVPDIGRIGLLTGLFSALLMPLILKPMGKEIWDAYNASLPLAGAAAFLALLLDMRRPGYPLPDEYERYLERATGKGRRRRKGKSSPGG
jgi:hypothetical protein